MIVPPVPRRLAPWPRRTLLGQAARGAAAGAVAGLALAPAARAATTRAAANPVVLTWLDWGGWPAYAGPHWQTFIQPAAEHFEAAHPGIKLKIGAPQGGNTAILSAILAGVGPDVFQDWVMSPYLEAGAALNLRPYITQDNIPLSTWSPGQMRTMMTETGIWALPTYVHCDAIAINLSILDQLGLQYPDPDWTYEDAEKLFRAATFKNSAGTWYGFGSGWDAKEVGEFVYPFHLWGGAVRDATGTKCTADQPNAYLGAQWYQRLLWDKVAYPSGDYPTSPGSILNSSGTFSVFQEIGANSVPVQLNTWRDKIKWTYWPVPHFPGGRASFEADDFYMVSAATKYPDAAWELMKFLTADPWWQYYCMKYMLRTPGMVELWDDWIKYVENAAPVARGKNLQAYKEAAMSYAVAPRYFKYDDTAVEPILSKAMAAATNRQGDLPTLLGQAARQINAHEAAAAAVAGETRVELARVNALIAQAVKANGNVTWGPPAVQGLGTPAKPAAQGAVTVKGNTVTIVGTGPAVTGTDDGLTFACIPWTKTRGTFTCRLVSVSKVGNAPIQANTKIGLMARGDLTTEAVDCAVLVAMGRSVQAESRPVPASTMGDQGTYNTPGLLGESGGLLQDLSKPFSNYLVKPIWLRLVQDINRWTAYASLDGVNWQQQGKTMGLEVTSVWVGVFVSPAEPDNEHVQAVFDHLSFTPTHFYQFG